MAIWIHKGMSRFELKPRLRVDLTASGVCCLLLPSYRITEQVGYSQQEVDALMDFLRRNVHLIMEFAQTGGFENASAV